MDSTNCIHCNSSTTNPHVEYSCGTRIEKFFEYSPNNPVEGWYAGTIVNHVYVDDIIFVQYDDGDEEALSNRIMSKRQRVRILPVVQLTKTKKVHSKKRPQKKPRKSKKKPRVAEKMAPQAAVPDVVYSCKNPPPRSEAIIIKEEENVDTTTIVTQSDSSTISSFSPASVGSSIIDTANQRDVTIKQDGDDTLSLTSSTNTESSGAFPDDIPSGMASSTTESSASNDNAETEQSVPDDALSKAAVIHREVLATSNQDVVVKKEGDATQLSPEERQKRAAAFTKWKEMNTDPKTGEGRYVFRRSCHRDGTITTVLKGSGMDPFPVVNNPPRLYASNEVNPFISPGEFYVAGCEAWNPFGPRFPGDQGLVSTEAFDGNPDQKEFHMFVQCSQKPHRRHWHGEQAAGGRMYVGVYKVPEDNELEMVVEYAKDDHLCIENKKEIAEWYVRKYYTEYGQGILPDEIQEHQQRGKQLAGEEWDAPLRTKHMWTVMAFLTHTKKRWDTTPVEFVRFDEELYQCLVLYNCAVSRQDSNKQSIRGRVSLDKAALRQYF